ncbi:HAMP domain-containing sensor histidine kinase [Umezawaea sp. Da 62-37]|uniref:sensor histidine kinase n=1 Tax=Umezawaea sp. Da 62-37 TaxID=3075927 RepID=UPI0028F6E1A2|nr:HAMP domain-containing sensor histidine kinase [Umezawaea sp. Da 62-37]WNV81925.1 HAMP domain-containing sensor histidine kinase [Umezawaea sp. Da 62-37]
MTDRFRLGRLRLGTRLVLGLGALALVVFAAVGTVMATSMRSYLDGKLDEQMRATQIAETETVKAYGNVKKVPQGWYSMVFTVHGEAVDVKNGDRPKDLSDVSEVARDVNGGELYRTVHLDGEGTYRVRACAVVDDLVLVSAAPTGDRDSILRQLISLEVVVFLAALVAFVLIGRGVLRRGLRPLSDMADTAHTISTRDLTDTGRLPVRASGQGGGVEVEELRTAFNTMLDHIDSSLAARTAAEQRLRRFVADASHELRTPLTSLRGYADLFRYAAANEPAEREAHLERMRDEAARMSVLLDDLLLLARLDSGEVEAPLRVREVDLVELAEDAASAFAAAYPDHPLTTDFGTAPVRLRADPMRLRQVLDNLLTNAAVHTPAGTGVALSAFPTGVTVVDSGPGIPAADQARIFDRFYRVDNSRARHRGGSGLGLAVVQSLVTAHGGTVEVDSGPGRTAFTIRLPA